MVLIAYTVILSSTLCFLPVYAHDQPDFTCTQYTNDDNDHSLQAGSSIIVTSNTLQRITCVTKNTEIISFNYNFDPPDAVVKRSEDYSPKHGVNFYLNRSAVLTIRSLNETSHNDGTYSLTVNIITVQESPCSSALASFNPSHRTVHWTNTVAATVLLLLNMLR